jgi:RNA polymerase sigma-70 factor (ECF subfamily)
MPESLQEFSAVYAEYYPKIAGYLRRLVGDADAEDVAQETFVKVNRSLDSFRGESRFSTWIYRIAMNTAMDHLRKPSARQALRQGQGTEEGEILFDNDSIPDKAPLHDTLLLRRDMNDCIRGLVDDLPEKYRTVLVLAEIEGLTNAETGAVLGLSLHTVKIRLHRARTQLKKSMETACNLYNDERNELSCERRPVTLAFKNA